MRWVRKTQCCYEAQKGMKMLLEWVHGRWIEVARVDASEWKCSAVGTTVVAMQFIRYKTVFLLCSGK